MKKVMKHILNYAIWLDHKKALIISRDEKGITHQETLLSEVPTHERFAGETTSKTRLFGATLDSGKKIQNREQEGMKHYFKKILDKIPSTTNYVLITGPADAKYELHKAFSKKKALSHLRIEMKTTAKMTADAVALLLKTNLSQLLKPNGSSVSR